MFRRYHAASILRREAAIPFRNKVDPFGEIHAVAARGMFTGNRGVIHDPETKTLLNRRWTTKAWIICDCGYKGLKREIMGRNAPSGGPGWTNLFFLDEVTALAAGHRPCFLCRREKAKEFVDCFGKAFGIGKPKVAEIDARLHRERLASGGKVVSIAAADEGAAFPDGAMIADRRVAYAIKAGRALRWSFSGYRSAASPPMAWQSPFVLTPTTTLEVLRAGYVAIEG